MPSSLVVQQFPLDQEYKKDTGISHEDIARLRGWLDSQPHLPGEYVTDLDLVLAYHSCELSTELTKQVLDLHFTLKTLFQGFFKDRVVDGKVERILNCILLTPLPTRTEDGYACFYARFLDLNPKHFIVEDMVRALFMILELWQYEEGTWPGLVLVVDLQGIVLGHLSCLHPQVMQQYLYFLQEAVLTKLKSLHFMNAPSFMDKMMTILRPFLKKALLDVLHIHTTGSRAFEDFYSLDSLPKEAGGSYKTLEECKDDVIAKLKANPEFFALENKKRVTETLRQGRPKTVTDFFGGVEGSFKKLNVD